MSHDAKEKGGVSAVFVKFAEVPEGVQIVASSDASIRRLKENVFKDYDTGCAALNKRLGTRSHPPSSLVCELAH